MVLSKTIPRSRLVFASRLNPMPYFSEAALSKDKLVEIFHAVVETVELSDIVFLLFISFFTLPIARIIHGLWYVQEPKTVVRGIGLSMRNLMSKEDKEKEEDTFKSTYTYVAAQCISQMAVIAMIVYIIDCIVIVVYLQGIEVEVAQDLDVGGMSARILFTTWFGFRCMRFKRYLLGRVVNKSPEKLGKALVYDRFLDLMIYAILTFSIMGTLDIQVGNGLKSVFALSGVGTLMLGIASQDMAQLFVSGVALSTFEKFRTGDLIRLGDKTTGVVSSTGLLFTEVRGGDEVITKIPNNQLANQRVSNLSRMQKCQVKQTLRFHYEDLPKIPKLLESIKQEIQDSCEHVITDGSRPFRANLNEFHADHVEVVVDTRYNLPPIGAVYFDNRQKVLEAIARAVDKHKVKFAIPEYHVVQSGSLPLTAGGAMS